MKALTWVALAGLLAVHPATAAAADSQVERASLTGLAVMSVVVEDLGPLVAKLGLTTDALQRDVEGRLRSRTWEATDGTPRRAVEVVANRLQALSRKESTGSAA